LNSPKEGARFRGSLIDDAMFAIDVEEWGMDNILQEHRNRRTKIEPLPDVRST
jgi:hypothetical protein